MAVHHRTKGFFLKKTDFREDSRLFIIYTENFGKLKILGKAIRKIGSKLKSGAEVFCLSEIEFIQGKSHKTLTDALLIENFPAIRQDFKRLAIVKEIAELLDVLASKEEKDEAVWRLLLEVLGKLNSWRQKGPLAVKNRKLEILYHYFFWNLVSIFGYEPEFQECSINKTETDCDIVKIIRLILKKDWPTLSRLKISARHSRLLKIAAKWYTEKITL